MELATCQYKYEYEWSQDPYPAEFDCDQEVRTGSIFCIFHDKNYVKDHYVEYEHEAIKRFEEKVIESSAKNKPLECIGYYLPEIVFAKYFPTTTIAEQRFSQRVDFTNATFYGANFNGVTFYNEANFTGVTFYNEAKFSETTFCNEATFRYAKFYNQASFIGTTFSSAASFYGTKFYNQAFFHIVKFYNHASFYEATFSKEADFSGTKFYALTNFTDVIFYNKIDFDKATFFEEAIFSYVTFRNKAYFSGVVFYNTTTFFKAVFYDNTHFFKTMFYAKTGFNRATFSKFVSFSEAKFCSNAYFYFSKFLDEAYLSCKFKSETFFNYVLFEQPSKVTFDMDNMSEVSFSNTDITRIRFSDKVSRGGRDRFTVIEEKWLQGKEERKEEEFLEGEEEHKKEERFLEPRRQVLFQGEEEREPVSIELVYERIEDEEERKEEEFLEGEEEREPVSIELILSVYRNLRENYEFRLRYDEAGKFFIKEMELKRKYREAPTISPIKLKVRRWYKKLKGDNSPIPNIKYVLIQNGPLTRNFSLNGLYYHFSRYGESIWRPTAIGAITVGLSTLFWLIQNNPTIEPSLSFISNNSSHISNATSNFINMTRLEVWNSTHLLRSFERSFADFLPLLPMGSDIKVGIIDYIIKIVGGALTFGLLAIALRRKFERKYTR